MGIRHLCRSGRERVRPSPWMANGHRLDSFRALVISPSTRRRVALAHRIALGLSLFLLSLTGLGCAGLIAADPLSLGGHPSITTQPPDQTVTVGQSATFTVVASGRNPLNYQWQKNGVAISGATSSIYTTPATRTSDNGAQFTVVVSNIHGSVTSNAATLTVSAAPVAPS